MSRVSEPGRNVEENKAAADRLRALGHPVRLAILRVLSERSCCCCSDVCCRLPLAQSTVSQHLKVLTEAGLVTFRRDGVRSAYVLNFAALAALRADLEQIASLFGNVSATQEGPAVDA